MLDAMSLRALYDSHSSPKFTSLVTFIPAMDRECLMVPMTFKPTLLMHRWWTMHIAP